MTTFSISAKRAREHSYIHTQGSSLSKHTAASLRHSARPPLLATESHGTDVPELKNTSPAPRPTLPRPSPHQCAPAEPPIAGAQGDTHVQGSGRGHFASARVHAARDAGGGQGRGVRHLVFPHCRRHPGRRRPPPLLRHRRLPRPTRPLHRRAVLVHVRHLADDRERRSRRWPRRHRRRALGRPVVAERGARQPGHLQGGPRRYRVRARLARIYRPSGRHVPAGRRAGPGRHRRRRGGIVQQARPRAGGYASALVGPEGEAAAADAGGSGGNGGGRRGGAGRERQLHDGGSGPGRGAVGARGGAVRDLREARGVQGDGGGEEEEMERDDGRRRHGRHGHLWPPQLRGRLLHLPHRHRRRERQGVRRAGLDVREHGGAGEAPGGGAAVRL